ncbi:NDP-sugar epimerase, includes UDP-GlcNAc-inverting 4,6-dehydratase FlaA1 and capsular polysaccharide biosynthesis protein EpsC [Lutibacter oricola]|uniref:NDP-sugar epimerase, includes UDP-GlcNAc-inverting 4,6-dehydratase FlaA1 and capsular polysaccharide biosynthesis protein EpsC n=1 Tax=Lutibacter oricola TaxID=762486 RepID=A0A1H3FQG8_9FLAO|nr:nucleoside-diphosphate sugar epimerase/dehydratase [Lutibacter oricola]SDX93312.1 NDP-sugar epimerase, includes UDP-GlcNAc-inverting 4,6-dehydratase FlaA1 and capsular polysaccharide biosynthesis protein EpsC [Lutibacter oricola]
MVETAIKKAVKRNAPRWLVLLIDIYIVANLFIVAYFIRFNFRLDFDTAALAWQIPLVVLVAFLCMLVTGSYKGIIRHTGVRDAVYVIFTNILISGILATIVFVKRLLNIETRFTIPISIIIIHFLLNVMVMVTSRYVLKELYYLLFKEKKAIQKVLIYGAGETGLLTQSVLREVKENKIQVVGFVDDNKRKWGVKIMGLHVYSPNRVTRKFVESRGITEIIIAFHKENPKDFMEITNRLSFLGVEVKIVPPATTWVDGEFQSKQIKQVKIEDLLGRKPIEILTVELQEEIKGKVVLVTGAAGSIGSELARQLQKYQPATLLLLDQAESPLYDLEQEFIRQGVTNFEAIVGDVRGEKRMLAIFKHFKPQMVFHAAAYKHVPLMEKNPYEAVNVNVLGTRILAKLAVAYKVEKFVMVSTDKAVNPTNVMGASKRLAELMVSSLKDKGTTKFITTRFGNVLGSNGSVIPLFKRQLENGGPLTVTHKEITRYFMTIPEACSLVLEAGVMGKGGEIFVFDMGASVRIFDLAKNMIRLSGLSYPNDIDIEITGLRPGEKIYEELLADGENTVATYHPKIMIAKVRTIDCEDVEDCLKDLSENLKTYSRYEIVAIIKKLVPEFVSNNSEYETLDTNYKDSRIA